MDRNKWNFIIKNNFNKAAFEYSNHSNIQKHFSKKIIYLIKKLYIPKGKWFELGSGTGFLADQIECEFIKQKVTRIDFSQNMLNLNKLSSKKILWDLNYGLPPLTDKSSLLVSNFCLHWLNEPEIILKKWFDKLRIGGFLIVSFPSSKCFPEWENTCKKNDISFSAIEFPDIDKIKKLFKQNQIVLSHKFIYKENFQDIYKLFRSIINIGAQSTKSKRIKIKEFKKMQNTWPKDINKRVNLTWEISILILKKNDS